MKKIYSSPVIRLTQIRPSAFMAGSAQGSYDKNSMENEGSEDMSRRNVWSFNDDEY